MAKGLQKMLMMRCLFECCKGMKLDNDLIDLLNPFIGTSESGTPEADSILKFCSTAPRKMNSSIFASGSPGQTRFPVKQKKITSLPKLIMVMS